ncbi:hypothetical protein LTR91_025624 [Friedmanniomyces endolithicus]|uniref:Uncharacterized protein n=1 Tax=Friedmanniomyces endolithicus TaxID=329885 RepID=A0AAN6GYX7_9PEZI|nr:hypothetical protein LTR94_012774 [Friedmanniomyces endolithicus]KAK0779489.1 hypothetical protein LTR59_013133 [Friedmanniomyces endolithicus]KAK0783066.1 hypothetical protein LTR75_014215 [Friedmanniomyces endolithicus]KAK0785098.1 hypothetical protein LTR38_012475 [Friedmanniomyces endolithicus]KAK0836415.1 hypothetical protein LTR03_013715 [Friedmanniomyces endolithicus]
MRTSSQRVDSAQPEHQHTDGVVTRATKRALQGQDLPPQGDEAGAAATEDSEFLSDSNPVNNKHLTGTLTINFENIQANAETPWRQILQPDIMFQAEGATEKEQIGYINLTLVHTTVIGSRGGKPWIRGLLRTELAKDDKLKTVSDALRFLWDTSGRLRKEARQFSVALNSNTIAYVCTIFLEPAWRNKGLGLAAMQVLHRILPTHLKHANVTMLLQPSMLKGDSPAAKAADIQQALLGFYGQQGYRTMFEDQPGVLPNYTLMARKL